MKLRAHAVRQHHPTLPGFEALAAPAPPPPDPDEPRVSARRCYPPRSDPRAAQYRYRLEVDFEGRDPGHRLLVIGMNPSTADEQADDPTMTRVIARAWRLGFGGLDMGNLFGIRSTDPDLRNFGDPVGAENDGELFRMASRAAGILVAWGNNGLYLGRSDVVGGALARIAATAKDPAFGHCRRCGRLIQRAAGFCSRDCVVEVGSTVPTSGIPIWCFKVTKEGQPEHPLYQRDAAVLKPWSPRPIAFKCAQRRRRPDVVAQRPAAPAALHLWRSRHHVPACLVCGAVPAVAHLPCSRGGR